MRRLDNGDFVLKPIEMSVLIELISTHWEDPREHLQNAIRESYGDDTIEEYGILFAIEHLIQELEIGCNESLDYVSVFERKPETENMLLARKQYKESLKT